jgi:EAL domain-containing protein (putative c-di-GMP-specific phosphodiesterase class I)
VDWRQRVEALIAGGGPTMVFQPIHRLADGQLIGREALARFPSSMTDEDLEAAHGPNWRLGAYTSEGPGVWFEMADLLGLGVELEVSAIRAALARLGDLPAGEYVAVNVGPETLVSGQLAKALGDADLSRVVVELTEHLAIPDYGAVRSAVVELQEAHRAKVCTKVGRNIPAVAADDMGAGEASLRHLLELRTILDYCKLDIALTVGIDTDEGRRILAGAIVGMGEQAGFKVVAEGVEHAAQVVTLQSIGVFAAQGYYLGRPGPLPTD